MTGEAQPVQMDFWGKALMGSCYDVCRVTELAEGKGKTVRVGDKLVAVFCHGGNYHAIDDVCPHMGASLSEGDVEDGIVTCPWHGWRFRLADGTWADSPRVRIGSYAVSVADDMVRVHIQPQPISAPPTAP